MNINRFFGGLSLRAVVIAAAATAVLAAPALAGGHDRGRGRHCEPRREYRPRYESRCEPRRGTSIRIVIGGGGISLVPVRRGGFITDYRRSDSCR